MTLRQVWVRLRALPAEAPLLALLDAEAEKAEAEQKERDVMSTLAQFRPPKEG